MQLYQVGHVTQTIDVMITYPRYTSPAVRQSLTAMLYRQAQYVPPVHHRVNDYAQAPICRLVCCSVADTMRAESHNATSSNKLKY